MRKSSQYPDRYRQTRVLPQEISIQQPTLPRDSMVRHTTQADVESKASLPLYGYFAYLIDTVC